MYGVWFVCIRIARACMHPHHSRFADSFWVEIDRFIRFISISVVRKQRICGASWFIVVIQLIKLFVTAIRLFRECAKTFQLFRNCVPSFSVGVTECSAQHNLSLLHSLVTTNGRMDDFYCFKLISSSVTSLLTLNLSNVWTHSVVHHTQSILISRMMSLTSMNSASSKYVWVFWQRFLAEVLMRSAVRSVSSQMNSTKQNVVYK